MKARPLSFPSRLAKGFNLSQGSKVLLVLLVLPLSGIALGQTGDGYDLSWHVVSGGGGLMASSNYAPNGTIGQVAIGPAESTNYGLGAGYWYGVVIQAGLYEIYLPVIFKGY